MDGDKLPRTVGSLESPRVENDQIDYDTYEDRVQQYAKTVPLDDEILFFPEKIINVQVVPKQRPKGLQVAPAVDKDDNIELYVKESFRYFSQSEVKIERIYKNYKKDPKIENEKISRRKYECDLKKKSDKAKNNFELMSETPDTEMKSPRAKDQNAPVPKDMDYLKESISGSRNYIKKHVSDHIYRVYDMSTTSSEYEWDGGAERNICKRYRQRKSMEDIPIMIEVKKFTPLLFSKYGEIEPVFLSLCLVDLQAKKKISETFHVDTNSNEIMSYIPTFKPNDKITRLKRAVFHITHRSTDIVLFVKVSKVLQGDEDSSTKPYTNVDSMKETEAKKMKKAAEDFVKRLSEFRQTIAWSTINIFDSDLVPIEKPKATQFYRTKGSFTDANFLAMFDSTPDSNWQASGTRKLKVFPATLEIELTNLVDYKPEYDGPIALVNNQEDDSKPRIEAQEMREFAPNPRLEFNDIYRNVLYVYPNFGHYNARLLSNTTSRNITVKVELKDNDKDLNAPGLPAIVGRSGDGFLQTCAYTEVTYHNRHPEFGDEFKILLPTNITPSHHILFTHYHVSAQVKNNKTTVIGYTVVPLLHDGKLINETRQFPIVHEFFKKNDYTSVEVRSNSKLLDSGKHVFQVTFHADSTVYPSNSNLTNFFRKMPLIMKRDDISSPTQLLGGDPDVAISKAINDLQDSKDPVPPYLLIQNMPLIFNILVKAICNPSLKQSSSTAYKMLLRLIEEVSDQDTREPARNELLSQYIDSIFLDEEAFEPLLNQFYTQMNESVLKRRQKTGEEKSALQYSWCIFEMIYKSLVLYLNKRGELKNQRVSRWMGSAFLESLDKVTKIISLEIGYRSGASLNIAKTLNVNYALFMRDLCDVIDRGIVMQKCSEYLNGIGTFGESKNVEVLQELRATFLQVFIDYEHFVPLSLPSPTPSPHDKFRDHYAAGLLIENILCDLTNNERVVRQRVINLIKAILTKHDYDIRYQRPESRERIAAVYFPFVIEFFARYGDYMVVAENKLPKLQGIIDKWKTEKEEKEGLLATMASPTSEARETDLTKKYTAELEHAQKQLDDAESQKNEELKRIKNEKQSMYINILAILKNASRKMLREWWRTEAPNRLETFIEWMSSCLDVFEYEGRELIQKRAEIGAETSTTKTLTEAKSQLENMYNNLEKRGARGASLKGKAPPGKKNVRDFKMNRLNNSAHLSQSNIAVTSPDTATGSLRKDSQKIDEEMIKNMVTWEGNLNTEVSLVILELILEFSMELNTEDRQQMGFIESLFKIFGKIFSTNQSETVLLALFSILRVLIRQFATVIFSNESSYSEQFCRQLLQMCYSKFERVRGEACAVLYHLIRVNYETLGNFTRTKIQTTVALSSLTGDKQFGEDRENVTLLRSSFEIISQYAAEDKSVKGPSIDLIEIKKRRFSLKTTMGIDLKDLDKELDFADQVKQLVDRLNKTLSDTVKIREADKEDEENYTELFYRIANGYRHAPELSVAWFGNLGKAHDSKDRHVEAAQCDVYLAAVVYHYLKMRGDPFAISQGINYDYILNVSPQIRTEKFQELKALFLESTERPSFESHCFYPKGFIQLIHSAIDHFDKDCYYEYSIQLWKLLIEHYEKIRAYDNLVKAHEEVSKLYGHISRSNLRNTRLFGSYYRIVFYGQKVSEDLRAKPYVYKMPKIFRLAELVDYFKGSFAEKFGGEDNIKIVGDTFQVTNEVINDPTNVHIMITNIRPYYDSTRQTQFEQNADIKEFVFETPFTKSGKSHGALNEQYKRRTILTVETAYPNMLTRQLVTNVSYVELTPVQNAIEIVNSSIDKLNGQIAIDPPDINGLHLVLSGSLIPQVNEGVPQIVNLFLKDPASHNADDIRQMKSRMVEFLRVAGKGLEISRKNSKPTQMPLHEKFEEGFTTLYHLFEQFMDVSELSSFLQGKKKKAVNFA